MAYRIFLTVGEVSGDNHAAHLIEALKTLDPTLVIEGLGGPAMAKAGAIIHHETTRKAAMTFHAVKRIFEIKRLLNWTRDYCQKNKPDLHICIDSSGFNLRFARQAKAMGVPVLYYVAPQLWASREGRIAQVRQYVDRLACILPFEEKWFRDRGVNATFVGHPLFDSLPADRFDRAMVRFPDRPPVIGIVPGSRKSEVKENFPHLLDVMDRIRAKHPEATFKIPTTPAGHDLVTSLASHRSDTTIVQNGFDELIPPCDLVITKSGTSTLHVAAWGVPLIVVYRLSPLLWHTIGKRLVKTPKIALVNILAGNIDLVPEFIPWHGSNEPVANCALDYLAHPQKLVEQRQKLQQLVATLDRQGASMNCAKLAMELLKSR